MEDRVPIIMENVFECTLEMINKDFSEYPQHRVEFFKLLKAINYSCFPALLRLDGRQFKFIIDSCLWASKHDNREVEGTGLTMLMELIENMSSRDSHTSGGFFKSYFLTILQDVFFVLTDTDHKAGKRCSVHVANAADLMIQGLKHNRCCWLACSSLSPKVRLVNHYIHPTKHSQVQATRTSYEHSLATCCRQRFPIYNRKSWGVR